MRSDGMAVFILNGRCGSTLLQTLLYETGEFAVYGEPPPGENAFVDELVNQVGAIPNEDFETRLDEHYRGCNFYPGARVMSKHPNYAFILDVLDRVVPDLRIICLERSVIDVVRSLVAGDMLDHVYRHYFLGAPRLMDAMLEDYASRTGECPATDQATLVGLYTACRYLIARKVLGQLPRERWLRIEFLDWMDHFEARSRDILSFVGLNTSYAAKWTASRNRRVQHTGRSEVQTSYHESIAELPEETLVRLQRITKLYGLQDLPTAKMAPGLIHEVQP